MRRGAVPDIVLVAAVAENGVIGREGGMPWRLKSDLQRFKALTLGKPVIMGRKTFQSIGKPLSGRTNIIVTRDQTFAAFGAVVAPSLDAALDVARGDADRRSSDAIMIIGGAEIYAQTLPGAARLEITLVHAEPAGDTRFPPIDLALWREVARISQEAGPGDSAKLTYLTYERV